MMQAGEEEEEVKKDAGEEWGVEWGGPAGRGQRPVPIPIQRDAMQGRKCCMNS